MINYNETLDTKIKLLILMCKDEKIKSQPLNYQMRIEQLGYHLLEYYLLNNKLYGETK